MKVGDWVLFKYYSDPCAGIAQISGRNLEPPKPFDYWGDLLQLTIFNKEGNILRYESEIIPITQIPYEELGIYLSQMAFSSGQKLVELLGLKSSLQAMSEV